jgi:hypothetical protein
MNWDRSLNKRLTVIWMTELHDRQNSIYEQIQQAIQKCNMPIDKSTRKYVLNIKPMAPKISAYIKTHEVNEPIRRVIDNTEHHHKILPNI